MKHNKELKRIKSSANSRKLDPAKIIEEIQTVIRNTNYDDDHTALSDRIQDQTAIFDMLMNGLWHLYDETPLGDEMESETMLALSKGWADLQKLIKEREDEHRTIMKLATHG